MRLKMMGGHLTRLPLKGSTAQTSHSVLRVGETDAGSFCAYPVAKRSSCWHEHAVQDIEALR